MDRRLRRAAVTAATVLLAGVTVPPSGAAVTQRIANGGFESLDAQWTASGVVICTETTCGRSPAGGKRFVGTSVAPESILGGLDGLQLGSVSQRVYLPEAPVLLTFRARQAPGSPGTLGYLRVFYGGAYVTEPDVSSTDWQTVTVPLPDTAADPDTTGVLLLATYCDNLTAAAAQCPVIDVDDVKLRTGSDTEPPQTRITKGPSGETTSRKVTFRFTSSEKGSTFECKIDDGAFKACTSPATQRVPVGSHTFRARATDASGNTDPTPAKLRWRVLP